MTELAGKPDSMKCADSDEIMRSACAKARRFGGCPVMRCLLRGSTSASASGCRARFRLNNVSSVGEAVGWVTVLLWLCHEGCTTWQGHFWQVHLASSLRFRLLPPGFRQIARQRGRRRLFYPIPSRYPLLLHVNNGDSVEARHQDAVERPDRGDEGRLLARLEQRRDQDVDGGLLRSHVIPRAGNVGGLAAKVEGLLVAGGQRLIPAVLQHVELVAEPALVELHGIDRAHADLDAGAP